MSYRIHLSKENFKFSGTHFTIFSSDQSERLHGHNYYVTVEIDVKETDASLGMAVDFNVIKGLVRELCSRLDEFVLVPARSPYLKIEAKAANVLVSFAKKTYSFPAEDIRELPILNVTSEELAKWMAGELALKLRETLRYTGLTVRVDESRGQGVSYTTE